MVEADVAFVGAISSIWSVAKVTEERADTGCRHPLQASGAFIQPFLSNLTNPHDLGGWEYPDSYGGPWIQGAFKTNGGATIRRYYFCFAMDNSSGQVDTAHFFYPYYLGCFHPANGWLSVATIKDGTNPTTKYGLRVYEYSGGSWGSLGGTATTVFDSDGTIYYGTLEVDMSGGTGNHVVSLWTGDASAMMNSGDPWLDAVALTNDAVITATPCFWNFKFAGGKSGAQLDAHSFEVFGQDDTGSDTARIDYYGAATQPHAFTMVPRSDVAGGVWTASVGTKWGTLDDPFDDADGVDDYISVAGDGSNKDQQFEMNDDYHVEEQAPTIYGLHVISACHDLSTLPTYNLAHCPTEGGAADPDAGVFDTGGNYIFYRYGKFYELTPGSNAWSGAKLDEFRAGVRNDHASETRYAYHLFAQVLGIQLKRPANAEAAAEGYAHSQVVMTT